MIIFSEPDTYMDSDLRNKMQIRIAENYSDTHFLKSIDSEAH